MGRNRQAECDGIACNFKKEMISHEETPDYCERQAL